jgi:myo-inositol-1(or 4)-monophosphatase
MQTDDRYGKYLGQLTDFVVAKGDQALAAWQKLEFEVADKKPGDVATSVDVEIEREFASFIAKNFPDHGFLGEELPELSKQADYQWQIDPIDGTKYFAGAAGLWTTTAALVYQGEPQLGCIYVPYTKQLYTAIKGQGAFLNGSKLSVNSAAEPATSQITWDLPGWGKPELEPDNDYYHRVFQRLVAEFHRVRNIGSGTLSYAWTASGLLAAAVDPARHISKLIDIAAGLVIAQEAGAVVHRQALPNDYERLIVGPAKIVETIAEIFTEK